jgi:hypothetical protein
MRWLLLALAVLPAFTVTSALANDVHDVKCKGSSSACIQEAQKTCGGDYHVLDSESHAGGLLSDAIPGPVTWYSMTYECPNSRAGTPNFPFRGNTYAVPPSEPVERTTRQRVSVGNMARFCQGEASAMFKQRPQEILTLPVERDGGGFTVYGQFPPEGSRVTTFECHFDSSGVFKRVARN